jgi:bacillithiol biosynthesis deacetylase BshB1
MKLHILIIVAHPDDAELSCSGTILSHIAKGYTVGVIDLTEGELGSRGTIYTRRQEATESAKILGLSVRENLQMADGFFENDKTHQLQVIKAIRKYKPEIVITNAIKDRHPDHEKGGELVKTAAFLSGLRKIETFDEQGKPQEAWRPAQIFQMIQSESIIPDFVIDITPFWERKMEAILAFKTQFFQPSSNEGVQTFISSPAFLAFLEARARELGQIVGVQYAEGFTKTKQLLVDDLFEITPKSHL